MRRSEQIAGVAVLFVAFLVTVLLLPR